MIVTTLHLEACSTVSLFLKPQTEGMKNSKSAFLELKSKLLHIRMKVVQIMEKGRLRKVIGLSMITLMVVPFAWFLPFMISTVQNFVSPSPYTRIIVSGITQERKFGNNYYSFSYPLLPQNQSGGKFGVYEVGSPEILTFPTVVGTTYEVYGLEVKVSEVHSGYVVLSVKPS